MAEIWKPQSIEVYQAWVNLILNQALLTLWERNFINSIDLALNMKVQLTQSQAEVLEQIYCDKTK